MSDRSHPIVKMLENFIGKLHSGIKAKLLFDENELSEGDLLFLISFHKILKQRDVANYCHSLLLHASDLPDGRGWSPYIWRLVEGKNTVTVSILEVSFPVDSGRILEKLVINIPETALCSEINQLVFSAELSLIENAISAYPDLLFYKQRKVSNNDKIWPRRTVQDSEIDPNKSIAEQFNLLRVCDPKRYPAFFYHKGRRFKLFLEGEGDEN